MHLFEAIQNIILFLITLLQEVSLCASNQHASREDFLQDGRAPHQEQAVHDGRPRQHPNVSERQHQVVNRRQPQRIFCLDV